MLDCHPEAVSFCLSAKVNQGGVGLLLQKENISFKGGEESKLSNNDIIADRCLIQDSEYIILKRKDSIWMKKTLKI